MKGYNKLLLIVFTFLCFFFTSSVFSLEKERFVAFLKEYDAIGNKYNGKIVYAIENCYPDVAEFLILRGEEIISYQTTYSISAGDNKKIFGYYTKHPLITAIGKGYTNVAILLIQIGHWKAEEYRYEYHESVPSCKGYQVGRKNVMGAAIECHNYDVVLSLLIYGFDPNNSGPLNPIQSVFWGSFPPSFPDDRTFYSTPLLQAIESKKLNIAELLLKHGATVDKVSRSPCKIEDNSFSFSINFYGSPLLKAVNDNFIEGVLLLLSYEANPLVYADVVSMSPLELALKKGYSDIFDLLFDATVEVSQSTIK